MLLFMTLRLDFRLNFFTRIVVWHFDFKEPGSLSLQVSKMYLNKVITDLMFVGVLLQEEG